MTQPFQITETENAGLQRAYQVVIPADHLEEKVREQLTTIGKDVKLPGFRPGKVPMNILEQRYRQNALGEVIDKTINEAMQETLRQHEVAPVAQPDVKIESYEDKGDLTFSAAFEIMPESPDIDFTAIELEKPRVEVAEEGVESSLQRLAESKGETQDLSEDTPAETGHTVLIDFKGYMDGEAFEGGEASEFTLELGSGQFIPGFEDQLTGAKAGDELEVKVSFPDDYHADEFAGKEATFEVKVHKVQKRVPASIDDELAKTYQQESLEALREHISEHLQREQEQVQRQYLKRQLFDKLEELVEFDVPQSLLDQEFNAIWEQAKEEASQHGEDLDADEAKKEEYQRIARRRVQLGILLSQTAGRQNITVNQQDLQSAMIEQARMYPGQEQKIIEYFQQNPQRIQDLQGPILEEKAVEYVLEQVQQKDIDKTLEQVIEEETAEEDASDNTTTEDETKAAQAG